MDFQGGRTLDYRIIANIIAVKAHSTLDEAWSGLSCAYLTLDRGRSESEQAAYLIKVGVLSVKNELQRRYIGNSGVMRTEPLLTEVESKEERSAESLSNEIGKVLNLSEDAVGVIRSIADGECGASYDAIRWHLRNRKVANTRLKTTEVANALQRIHTHTVQ